MERELKHRIKPKQGFDSRRREEIELFEVHSASIVQKTISETDSIGISIANDHDEKQTQQAKSSPDFRLHERDEPMDDLLKRAHNWFVRLEANGPVGVWLRAGLRVQLTSFAFARFTLLEGLHRL